MSRRCIRMRSARGLRVLRKLVRVGRNQSGRIFGVRQRVLLVRNGEAQTIDATTFTSDRRRFVLLLLLLFVK